MTHLRIELNNIQENVSSAVIEKLYELAISGDLDSTSNLAGNLRTEATYQMYVNGIRLHYPDLYISADIYYMYFEDPEVRRILGTQLGDGTGVSSSTVVGYVGDFYTRVGNSSVFWFSGNTTIEHFDELDLFTGMTLLHENTFSGCTNLKSLTFPPNLTSIPQLCFKNCSSLNIDLILPSSVTGTGLLAFSNSAIKSITFPQSGFIGIAYFSNNIRYVDLNDMPQLTSITNIPSVKCIQMLRCPKLTSITLPDFVESASFNGDTLLQTIVLSTNSQFKDFCDIGHYGSPVDGTNGCALCTSLTLIVNFPKERFTVIPYNTFSSCTSLNDVNNYIGHNCTTIGRGAFYNAGHIGGSYVHIPSSVTTIDQLAFYGFTINKCPGFIFHSTTPPTIGSGVFQESYGNTESNTTNIYVPYSAISAYKAVLNFVDEPTNRTWKYKDKVYGYKIYQYSSSTWNELANPTEALIESASSNVLNSVPSSSATEGDLAFVIFNS